MKNKIVIIILFLFSYVGYTQIKFEHTTWAEVKVKAKKENKYIMVDAYTTWCGPCKWMSANTFTDKEVGVFFNENYVNYKLDMEKEGDGITFAETYQVKAFPTILFFNPQGEVIHKFVGSSKPKEFLVIGKDALNPDKQIATLEKRYKSGERNPKFLKNYLDILTSLFDDKKATEVALSYLATQDKSSWSNKENWKIIQEFTPNKESEVFKFVYNNKEKFKTLGEKEYYNFIVNIFGFEGQIYQLTQNRDESKLADLITQMKAVLENNTDKYIAKAKFFFYSEDTDADKKMTYAHGYLSKYSDDWIKLNFESCKILANSNNKQHLRNALIWAKKSIELDENFYNTDTYASLLFKLGKKKKAKIWSKKSITHFENFHDWFFLNEVSWEIFENFENKERLKKALIWAKKSIELEENFYNTDTYANLLFKLENLKKAKIWAEKSIQIGKEKGEDVKETEALLLKINDKLK